MLSLAGFLIVVSVVAVLMSGKVSPIIALIVIPVVGALLAGFGLKDLGMFFSEGLNKVMSVAVIFIFAILYFGIMRDVGLFEPILNKLIDMTRGNILSVTVLTIMIAAMAHLDGSGASTFLIAIPALLPLYQHLKLSPYLLLLLVSSSASIMNMLPWAGPIGRVASVLGSDPVSLWYPLIPVQLAAMALLLAMAMFLGIRESRILRLCPVTDIEPRVSATPEPQAQFRSGYFAFKRSNFLLTVLLIATLMSGLLPSAFVFMLAVCAALMLNYPDVKTQMDQIRAHAPDALVMASVIFAAGVFLGVLKMTGMLDSLALSLISFLPEHTVPYLHIIVGIVGVPFELILNTDAYYFALVPVVQKVVSGYGVTPESAAYAMLIGNIVGTFVSPFSPALWLALGLAGLEMGRHVMYSFFWIWGVGLSLLAFARIIGII
ncbi:MAG: CitMHS family transporter [Oligoflexales bacterium]